LTLPLVDFSDAPDGGTVAVEVLDQSAYGRRVMTHMVEVKAGTGFVIVEQCELDNLIEALSELRSLVARDTALMDVGSPHRIFTLRRFFYLSPEEVGRAHREITPPLQCESLKKMILRHSLASSLN
jgi:hypothetical protein